MTLSLYIFIGSIAWVLDAFFGREWHIIYSNKAPAIYLVVMALGIALWPIGVGFVTYHAIRYFINR